jgi:mono/diheme cytochrome c family protein
MRQRTATVLGGALLGLVTACNSLDEPAPQTGSRVIVPVDSRATQQALTQLPAISGGTLAASSDGRFAIAADPDRDRVSIVDLTTQAVRHVALEVGDEPGRVVADANGRAFVALRRAGDVVSIDIASGQIEKRTHVCSAPRGLASDASLGLLHVACADGRLVTLHAAQGEVVRSLAFDAELRDVMVRGEQLLVSTFKSAELLNVDGSGEIAARSGAVEFEVNKPQIQDNNPVFDMSVPVTPPDTLQSMRPHLAWRTAQAPTGEVVMLHQGASEDEVDIQHKAEVASSPYGGGGFGGCTGIVSPAMTVIDAQGPHTIAASTGVLSVDMALSINGDAAIVQAGGADQNAPRPTTVFDGDGNTAGLAGAFAGGPAFFQAPFPADVDPQQVGTSTVTIFPRQAILSTMGSAGGCLVGSGVSVVGQATAVAFTPAGDMLVQSREPGLVTWVSRTALGTFNPAFGGTMPSAEPGLVTIELGGASVRDTGHEIFHRDAGGGIACASCHAEGAEDGHTWTFVKLGVRRTQALHVGLEGTAPFHWSGDESDMGRLMEDVFVGRMGGVHQSSDRLNSLTHWLFALRPPASIGDSGSDAAVRGKELFQSAATGCTSCHAGAKLTNNQTVDVGTGGKLQVPSLIGVGYRAPLMHTGCAATLRDRFDPACGGRAHGHVEQLQPTQVDDMVAYLRTL